MFREGTKQGCSFEQGKEVVKETLDKEKVPYMVVDNGGVFYMCAVHKQKCNIVHSCR